MNEQNVPQELSRLFSIATTEEQAFLLKLTHVPVKRSKFTFRDGFLVLVLEGKNSVRQIAQKLKELFGDDELKMGLVRQYLDKIRHGRFAKNVPEFAVKIENSIVCCDVENAPKEIRDEANKIWEEHHETCLALCDVNQHDAEVEAMNAALAAMVSPQQQQEEVPLTEDEELAILFAQEAEEQRQAEERIKEELEQQREEERIMREEEYEKEHKARIEQEEDDERHRQQCIEELLKPYNRATVLFSDTEEEHSNVLDGQLSMGFTIDPEEEDNA